MDEGLRSSANEEVVVKTVSYVNYEGKVTVCLAVGNADGRWSLSSVTVTASTVVSGFPAFNTPSQTVACEEIGV